MFISMPCLIAFQLLTKLPMYIPSYSIISPFVLGFLCRFYMRYGPISSTTHPTKGRVTSFVNVTLDIVSSYRPPGHYTSKPRCFLSNCFLSFISMCCFYPSILFQFIHFFFALIQFFFNSLRSTISSCVIFQLVVAAASIVFLMYQPRPFSSFFSVFTCNKSSSTIFPRNIQPYTILFWAQLFIH